MKQFLEGRGWSSEFQTKFCCAVFSTATNQWGRRGVVIEKQLVKYQYISVFFMKASLKA